MPTPVRNSARAAGFSLLEIMVVIVLIGLTVSLVVVNLERDLDQIAEREAHRFAALVNHAREESILTGSTMGIEIDVPERRFRFVTPGESWTPITNDDLWRERVFPEGIVIELDGSSAGQGSLDGLVIVVDAIGTVSRFTLRIRGDREVYSVSAGDFDVVVLQNNAQG